MSDHALTPAATTPGRHPSFSDYHFQSDEKKILDVLDKEFFLTNGGEEVRLGHNSTYRYIIVKLPNHYQEMFNIKREIVIVFSPYESIQARTLDVFDFIAKKHSALRVEKICHILISRDDLIEDSLADLIKNEPEAPIIIPFSYSELKKHNTNSFFIRNRFKQYFYTRDLFSFEAPLKTDIYFFGRNDLIQELINRFKSGENSGLFGLRKTGKTSLINGLQRNLLKENTKSIIIDCQDPSFNQRRWNESLYYITMKINENFEGKFKIPSEDAFTPKEASFLFESFLKKISMEEPIFLIFDEIENISRGTAPATHWNSGIDFALFWQSLRSIFQRNNKLLSYLIVGTNPTCIEQPKIDHIDNPIFNHFSPSYIPGFEIKDTREMVRKLGRIMGLKFDESLYSSLTTDYGGHPFLMRKVCSLIAQEVKELERPVEVGKAIYNKEKNNFILNHSNYVEMIIGVLRDWYPEEYEMLTLLANSNDDSTSFGYKALENPARIAHLLGYGLIKKDNNFFHFNIDSVKDYILMYQKYQKKDLSLEEKWAEISERRNKVEVNLRRVVKLLLKSSYGEEEAKNRTLKTMGKTQDSKYQMMKYNELFDPNISQIYFSDLGKLISVNWDVFKNSFQHTKKEVFSHLDFINQSRADAHAKNISDEEFYLFRLYMGYIESDLKELD